MKIQTQPNKWSCLPTAFAIALNMPVAEFLGYLDHDGSDVIYNDLPEPYCRRSFHIQEMVDICWLVNYAVIEIEQHPISEEPSGRKFFLPYATERVEYYLYNANCRAVLTGCGSLGTPHAVAWNGFKVYDPNGTVYDLEGFMIQQIFLIVKINITI